jgi:hypothetical protein
MVSQNDKRGDGVTARIQPDRKPLIEGVRADVGNVRTDGGKGRADRIQAVEGRAGSTRNQGAEGLVPVTRSGERKETARNENVKIESSRLDGAKSQNAKIENEISKTAKSNANPGESARTEGGRGSQKLEPAKTAGSEVTKIGPSDATPTKGMSESPSKVGPKAVPLKNNDSPAVRGPKDVPTKKGPFELAPGSLEPKPNLTARPKPPAALPQAENPHGVVRGDKFTARPLTPLKQPLGEHKPTALEGDRAGLQVPISGIRNAVGDLGQKLIDKVSRTLGEPKAETAKTVPVIDRAHHPVEIRVPKTVDSRLQKPLETKPTPFLEAHTVRVEQSEFRPMTGRPGTADGATRGFGRLRAQEELPADKPAPRDARPARREGEPIDGRHSGEAPRHIRDVFLKFNISIPKRSFHPAITDSGSYVALDEASSQRLNSFISSGTHKALKSETEFERRSNRSGWRAGVRDDQEIAPESDSIRENESPSLPNATIKDEQQLNRNSSAGTAGDTARKIYIVQSGDTSESIALVQLHDRSLARLIESVNEPMLQTVFDTQKNMHHKILPVGAMILLPNARDISAFREQT